MSPATYRAAVDVGSAFTHTCLLREDSGELFTSNVPSIPHNPEQTVIESLAKAVCRAGLESRGLKLLLYSSTLATNALLEGRGAKTALLVTRGFRDVLFIGRQQRPHLYDFWATRPLPLVPRHLTFEVTERVLASGEVLVPLHEEEVSAVAEELNRVGVSSVAVSFLHSYANPRHEQKVREILSRLCPEVHVSLSSEVLPEVGEYERTAATVINAFVAPFLIPVLVRLCKDLEAFSAPARPGLLLLQSDGSMLTVPRATVQGAHTILSGPAGGVLAGLSLSRQTGRPNLILCGMGSGSTYISLLRGEGLRCIREGNIGGHPLAFPMLDIQSVGVGGGSIGWIDRGGALRIGPHSAGANPGPVCYGLGGTEPTLTDAQLILGRLGPYLGSPRGGLALHPAPARNCLEQKIARPLGLSVEEAAQGMIRLASITVARNIRLALTRRGYDPRDFTLVTFGGAGPLHAAELARELGISHVLIPRHPGTFAALGMLYADVRRDYVFPVHLPLGPSSMDKLAESFVRLEETGRQEMTAEGFQLEQVRITRQVDLRYTGTPHYLTMPFPGGRLCPEDLAILRRSFQLQYEQEYGSAPPKNAAVEVVNVRVTVAVVLPYPKPRALTGEGRCPKLSPVTERPVYFEGQYLSTPVFNRDELKPGKALPGPAVIEEEDATTLVWPETLVRVDQWGNLVMEL